MSPPSACTALLASRLDFLDIIPIEAHGPTSGNLVIDDLGQRMQYISLALDWQHVSDDTLEAAQLAVNWRFLVIAALQHDGVFVESTTKLGEFLRQDTEEGRQELEETMRWAREEIERLVEDYDEPF